MNPQSQRSAETLELEGGSVLLMGHLDTIRETGVRPVRVPLRYWSHFPPTGEGLRSAVSNASGVRILVDTAATKLMLRVRCTRTQFEDILGPRNSFAAQVDGVTVATARAPVNTILRVPLAGDESTVTEFAEPEVVEFSPLPEGSKTVTIWLPQGMIVDLIGITGDSPVTAATPVARPVWVHHGSSISHCAEPELPTSVWPVVASQIADLEIVNLGFGGQCMLDPFVADAIAATAADVISIKVGVNMVGARSMDQRTFTPALHGFIDRIRVGHPDTPVVVASSILWPGSEDVPGPSDVEFLENGGLRCFTRGDTADILKGALTLADSRDQVARVVQTRKAGGENIHYLDGRRLFGPADLAEYVLPDSLHPDTSLYEEMGRRFARDVFDVGGLVPRSSITSGFRGPSDRRALTGQ